jgi:magnesium transporter
MVRTLAEKDKRGFQWIDVIAPDDGELQSITQEYGLHESSVQDWQQADHLPKYEHLKDYAFIILRVYDDHDNKEADTVQEVTNKIAVFCGRDFIITLHKEACPMLDHLLEGTAQKRDCTLTDHLLNEIIKGALLSYEKASTKLTRSIDYYENHLFLRDRTVPILKGMYFLKRKIDVIKRILLLSYDIIDQIDAPEHSDAYTRDTRDLYIKQQSIFDSLAENTNHLLNIYFNISAQKTNDTIRVLTIFSVFFMPLTFIVGIYGMNFKVMPELQWALGYPAVMVLMLVVTVVIYVWFKKKKWL